MHRLSLCPARPYRERFLEVGRQVGHPARVRAGASLGHGRGDRVGV